MPCKILEMAINTATMRAVLPNATYQNLEWKICIIISCLVHLMLVLIISA